QWQTFLDSAKDTFGNPPLAGKSKRLCIRFPETFPILTVKLCLYTLRLFSTLLPKLLHLWLPAGNMVCVDEEATGTHQSRKLAIQARQLNLGEPVQRRCRN